MQIVAKKKQDEQTAFGRALTRLRKEKGLSQTELADLTGIRRSLISRLEVSPSANPTWATVNLLATALGVKPDAFE